MAGQEEAHSLHHCTRSGAAAARCLAVGEVHFALQSSRSSGGWRCIVGVRSAGSTGRRRVTVGRSVGLEEEALEVVPSTRFL